MTSPEANVERWHSRDLPVLRALVRQFDGQRGIIVTAKAIVDEVGLDAVEATAAVNNLVRGSYVVTANVWTNDDFMVTDVTDRALYATQVWPTPQTGLDRMIAALETIADNTDEDDDTRTRARKALDALTGAGKHIGLAVATAYATGQVPG